VAQAAADVAGVCAILPKPFTIEQLDTVLHALCKPADYDSALLLSPSNEFPLPCAAKKVLEF